MPLVPPDFQVPNPTVLGDFRLRMLSIDDLEEDYAAVIESVNELQGVFGEHSDWPPTDLTKRQNLIDLGWHEKEFQRQTSFAYVIENSTTGRHLGCLYIYPSRESDDAANVYMWLRTSEYSEERIRTLWSLIDVWLKSWPFRQVHYPTRRV